MTSIVAKTGRRTQSSDSIGYSAFAVDGDLHAVGQVVDVGQRDEIARLERRR